MGFWFWFFSHAAMALIPAQLCKFADLDLHIGVNNQTLFKRGSSETEDGETRILPANLQQDYLRVRQTNQKQPPPQFYSCSPVSESRV